MIQPPFPGKFFAPRLAAILFTLAALVCGAAEESAQPSVKAQEPAKLVVKAGESGIAVSPKLYGIFFEEINRAGDGGLYGEMLQNRSFEDATSQVVSVTNTDRPVGWELVLGKDAKAAMTLDDSKPLNDNNKHSLKITIEQPGEKAGVANIGFRHWDDKKNQDLQNGVAVQKDKQYNLSLYARCDGGFKGPLAVRIEDKDGNAAAEGKIDGVGADWKKFEVTLKAAKTVADGKFALTAASAGTLWLDVVSLFPKETFKNRPNGMRPDLARMIAGMKPGFVRFPGGCFVEGDKMPFATRWKKTIGDIAERPGHWNLWGYWSNDGFGYHEFLQFCEDIQSEPMYVINCGMAHKDNVPMDKMQEMVQDALDAIEYANGPADSKWGALRAKAGHPEPFNMKLMEIGNENGGPAYHERYALFHDAIKAKYPEMQLIACVWHGTPKNRTLDIIDEHYYNNPGFFFKNANRYDAYDRKGPKIYVGEYAVTQECGGGNLIAAVGEAAFMTGMERNADIVSMGSYAPLFVNPAWKRWNPNAIVFDSARAYGIPSYHVQAMFGQYRTDTILPMELTAPNMIVSGKTGTVGVGAWGNTQAEFKDIEVTQDGKTVFKSDFSANMKGWKTEKGKWEVKNGVLRQTGSENMAAMIAIVEKQKWADMTLTLKARKLGGDEGFLILFQAYSVKDKNWWNLGGWGNTGHNVEGAESNTKVPGKIETGRWYDIKIETKGGLVRCYLDGKLIHEITRTAKSFFAVAGRKKETGEIIVKAVNGSDAPREAVLEFQGGKAIAPEGKTIVLTAEKPTDENSFDAPTKVAPKEGRVQVESGKIQHTFPACSVTVFRLKEQ